jgi:predicted O-methyltransferase YrrM
MNSKAASQTLVTNGVSTKLEKSARLLHLLSTDRREFIDRISAIFEVQTQKLHRNPISYASVRVQEGIGILGSALGIELTAFLSESAFQDIEHRMHQALDALPRNAPLGSFHNADSSLARIVYALARAVRPRSVVETGVCYGVTTGYILQALQVNRSGHLYSIDLPPLGENADSYIGSLVPQSLKYSWTLLRGSSKRLLPNILRERGSIEMFVHDSLHTLPNMRREFTTVWPFLRPGSVLVSDDIEENSAFAELSQRPEVRHSVILASGDKKALVGVAVKC